MRIPFLGGIGVPELIIILLVVLIIFGPKNLPKLGNAIGRTFKSMRDGMDGKKSSGTAEDAPAKDDASSDAKLEEPAEKVDSEEPIPAATETEPAEKAE